MNDFEEYMLDKIKGSFLLREREMNEAILSLYKRGYIDVDMTSGTPMLTVSKAGEDVYTQMLLASMVPVGEA